MHTQIDILNPHESGLHISRMYSGCVEIAKWELHVSYGFETCMQV